MHFLKRRKVLVSLALVAVFAIAALTLVADALILSNLADGVVLCVQGGVTPRENVLRARDALRRSGANILGVLINAVPEEGPGYGYGNYGAYGYGDAKSYHTDPVS